MLCNTLESWMVNLRDHACGSWLEQVGAGSQESQYDADDEPEPEKGVPRLGYKCKGCGKTFSIGMAVLQESPSFEGDFRGLFKSVDGRSKLATMMTSKEDPATIERESGRQLEGDRSRTADGVLSFTPPPGAAQAAVPRPVGASSGRLIQWEKLDPGGFEWRAPVPGGWLVKTMDAGDLSQRTWRPALAFVPDPEYLWGR